MILASLIDDDRSSRHTASPARAHYELIRVLGQRISARRLYSFHQDDHTGLISPAVAVSASVETRLPATPSTLDCRRDAPDVSAIS